MTKKTVALLVAAGQGSRAGGDIPKQFRLIGGKPVLTHAFDALARHPAVDSIILVVGAGQEADARAALGERPVAAIIQGADSRRGSVRAGLEHIASSGGAARLLIHDAARPFLPRAVIDRLLAALAEAPGAIPTLPVTDTLVRNEAGRAGEIVDRNGLARVQTPQAFHFDAILAAHRTWDSEREATDDAQMVRDAGHDVILVAGDERLEKLTYADDFPRAEARLAAARSIRTGMGYDVHRLASDQELWLCGIRIPHDRGLAGHSDADVAIHALVDALLGALAEGDIGSHFPPSDPQWRGFASSRFLEYAAERVAKRDGIIEHVDLTLICEAPKIGPHREAMRARIAEILGLPLDRVSVKATTTERLGFTGRREGIAAQAVATLSLPALF
ncbi:MULTISPECIES: bifunctional 2-C-methyl-D-erythritol 4-phosphate cytidylyltransferase/2-C-methyl-D-erythritol 2,4-cyclodiphosphate synthase [unclassified Sphingobium]|uniref:bifunctional 2-C-methyl-D-erythritol 4-phosphate cytidylyltransferase/2-C-methyl-D-erythritol 2,4-cyclodiphosphate synthase n=1 Tax=unclassified Sphingobium TaxID=2611147 RepID=UPI00077011E3|nr:MULTISPECIES: bifunctional 2-C-methyl-D-erythritol 4-phosphate cytidylyltransferase/2-C-methyl-D-erythritol 2,4-cyclodiphosphate synthase [unclassified Sphingobium]AMK23534.1 bifunctional 2-C-methyl-D-erythritol 4-phosphate cytidylyltransferase/2-C-methyl-D-erythritol 2,4-cyclodiphosphate synthase protein [Sphingobium sp. TKS]NML91370.1 bifunctional 2-C-methyl-D-erythritol 4-phosphate cytidylyltransferase/2-C-methyl-D-erythritol 2,4-cyclodiphosphate synthase [Sphingobium sp. TB-6]